MRSASRAPERQPSVMERLKPRAKVTTPTHTRHQPSAVVAASMTAPPDAMDDGGPELAGADLAAWRKRLGLTQSAAADWLGVRQGTISKAEGRAARTLGATLQVALAEALSE